MVMFISVLLGIFFGGIISKFLFVGSFLNLLPWGIVGLIIGWFSSFKKESLVNGAIYGFVLSFVFMLVGYKGVRPIYTVFPFFMLLGLFGALCGAMLGFLGNLLKKLKK